MMVGKSIFDEWAQRYDRWFAEPIGKLVQEIDGELVRDLLDPKPGEKVLDYCAGSGGKTLAFAPQMEEKGQIFLHDIRLHILVEAKRRLKRAGIQNAQVISPKSPHLKTLKKKIM